MIDHALNSHNEHLNISGDIAVSATYLPFARRNVNTLFNLSKGLDGTPLTKKFQVNNTTIKIRVFGDHKYIDIYTSEAIKGEVCGTYVSGLERNCQAVSSTTNLNEFFPKGGSDWQDLTGHAIPCNEFLTELGYETSSKTQQAYIKSSQYTGFMRYAIQNLLGQNKQIGYQYGFYNTDGLIVENIVPQEVVVPGGDNYFIQDKVDLRLIKISEDGVFIKDAPHCKPFNITFTAESPGLIDNSSPLLETHYENFKSLLRDTSFVVPEDLEGTSTQMLLDSTAMEEFYTDKLPLFNSCGWLIPSHHTYQQIDADEVGFIRTRIYGIFNTCRDETKSYLYGIKLTQITTYSSLFNTTSYEYTATLHKLLEGEMSSPKLTYPWIDHENLLYVPNENLDQVVPFSGIIEESVSNEFAPMYVYDDGLSYNLTHFNLSVVGQLNIFSDIQDTIDPVIKDLTQSISNFFGRRFFGNIQLGKLKILIDPTTFECENYTHTGGDGDPNLTNSGGLTYFDGGYGDAYGLTPFAKSFTNEILTDNPDIGGGVREVTGKITFNYLIHTNEKVIIPSYNRNAVLSVYNGNLTDLVYPSSDLLVQEFLYDYKDDGSPVEVITPYTEVIDESTTYMTAIFEYEEGFWVNTDGFNVLTYIKPYFLGYYKNMFNHYLIEEISLYTVGKYATLNMGSDYDINFPYTSQSKDYATDLIDYYIMTDANFTCELIFDIFSTNWVFHLRFDEGVGFIASIFGYPAFDNYTYINFVGRP